MKINSLVQNTIAICCCILVFIIAFIWIAFHFNDSTNAFKDSLSIGASFFSGIATLAAAYIASKLFNDWKEQHNKNIEAQLCLKAYDHMQSTNFKLLSIQRMTIDFLSTDIEQRDFDKFDKNLETLETITDETSIILADLGFILSRTEFNEKFKPQFKITIDQMEQYIETYKNNFRHIKQVDKHHPQIHNYVNLSEKIIQRHRSVFVELNDYYKAK